MNFFVAFFVLSCALFGYAQETCVFDYEGDGGVLNAEGTGYRPGSVLVWVDIARLSSRFANARAEQWLKTWADASISYNDALTGSSPIPSIAVRSINLANRCFCNLNGNIVNNEPLNNWYGSVCNDFGALLSGGNDTATNEFMRQAYPQFVSLICPQ